MTSEKIIKELDEITLDSLKPFDFAGITTFAKVLKVYDADTITVAFKFKDQIIRYNLRIDKIDSPELKSKNMEESSSAKLAQEYLSNLILNKIVQIKLKKFDKYGRILSDIFLVSNENEKNIANILVNGGYVRQYDGKKKKDWLSKELYKISC